MKPESELSEFWKVQFFGDSNDAKNEERQDRGKPTLFSLVFFAFTFQARRQEADNDREETHVFFSLLVSHFVVSIGTIEGRGRVN